MSGLTLVCHFKPGIQPFLYPFFDWNSSINFYRLQKEEESRLNLAFILITRLFFDWPIDN
ncbi:hypothetical protein [Piscirickettsia salmonis]|uniref:hypothetical protein n=1 Tax=Piscirickettsia salmonis TaxID=1238 RepID=UPI000AB44546|nr:hypothetical protein [Piscirickettsia salmonis]